MKDKRKLYNYTDDEIEEDFLEWRAGYVDSCWVKLDGMRWGVMIFQDWMTIGCQHHHIDDWGKFTDDEISKMDYDALEFWQANKQKLITIANLTK